MNKINDVKPGDLFILRDNMVLVVSNIERQDYRCAPCVYTMQVFVKGEIYDDYETGPKTILGFLADPSVEYHSVLG